MHEYKRQHLNALNIAAQYLYLKENPNADFIPKTYIFARSLWLHGQADDPHDLQAGRPDQQRSRRARQAARGAFKEYCVSLSEHLMPAAEVSEQISGRHRGFRYRQHEVHAERCHTLGTLDGANVEIADAAGKENELDSVC